MKRKITLLILVYGAFTVCNFKDITLKIGANTLMAKETEKLTKEDKSEIEILVNKYVVILVEKYKNYNKTTEFYTKEISDGPKSGDVYIIESFKISNINYITKYGFPYYWDVSLEFLSVGEYLSDENQKSKFIKKSKKVVNTLGVRKEDGKWKVYSPYIDDFVTVEGALVWSKSLNDGGRLYKQMEAAFRK